MGCRPTEEREGREGCDPHCTGGDGIRGILETGLINSLLLARYLLLPWQPCYHRYESSGLHTNWI